VPRPGQYQFHTKKKNYKKQPKTFSLCRERPRVRAFAEVLLRIAPLFRTAAAGQRVVEAVDKHVSLRFLDSHHHPLPHKPQSVGRPWPRDGGW
jgi:hypothetical protein